MIILPAIDIKDGNCVRLFKGDFSTVEKVAADYLETAKGFEEAGATWIHMVDLDGAKEGRPVNTKIYKDVAEKTSLKVEVGGGIRNIETIEEYLSMGISRVIIGSAALKNPQLVREAVEKFGREKIAVGIDSKDGRVENDGGWEFSTHRYQDATGGSNGPYWYHSNVDWSTAADGQPTIKVGFNADGSLAAVYYSEFPDQAGGTPGFHIDNLLLPTPESGSSVTAEQRALYIEAFRQNFPDYESFFTVATSSSGYQYLEVLEAGEPTVSPTPGSGMTGPSGGGR